MIFLTRDDTFCRMLLDSVLDIIYIYFVSEKNEVGALFLTLVTCLAEEYSTLGRTPDLSGGWLRGTWVVLKGGKCQQNKNHVMYIQYANASVTYLNHYLQACSA